MASLVLALNTLLSGVLDLVLRPLAPLGPMGSLSVLSAAVGAAMAWLFERLAPTQKTRLARRRVEGNVIALRLYQHAPGVFLRLQIRILLDILGYLRLALPAILVLVTLSIPLLVQLEGRYGRRPLRIGERALVTVRLATPAPARLLDELALESSTGIAVEGPGVRIPVLGEVSWRVRALGDGTHTLRVRAVDVEATKALLVGPTVAPVSVRRTAGTLDLLLHPGEPPLEAGTLAAIEVGYPKARVPLLGRSVGWVIVFLAVSIVAGQFFRAALASPD